MNLTEPMLINFFNKCCKGLGIKTIDPIISIWLNTEHTFGFIEFKSVQDTTISLSLFDGLKLGGRQLRFGRPIDYKKITNELRYFIVGQNLNKNIQPLINYEKGSPAYLIAKNLLKLEEEVTKKQIETENKVNKEEVNNDKIDVENQLKFSNVLCLSNMICYKDIKNDNEYNDIIDDIIIECIKFGELNEIVIERKNDNEINDENNDVRVFLKYSTISGAKNCYYNVNDRLFGEKKIKCYYYDKELFDKKEYKAELK